MATSAAVSVTDNPTVAIATPNGTRHDIAVHNDGAGTVYVGGATVTSATGFPIISGEDASFSLGESETLYGICAFGQSATLRVFHSS